jgi:indole-3-glycerol phosphate synthase
MDILTEICQYTALRIAESKKTLPLTEAKNIALNMPKSGTYAFENALKRQGLSLICEVKKASPSKGVIDERFDYMSIAKDYEEGGGDCISCLTEPKWFLGSDKIFTDIRKSVNIPMLRKDFTVDEYQIYTSKMLGADCVLIIMTATQLKEAQKYFELCNILGMSALFECRSLKQVEDAQNIGARIIGVNNRNLKDFSVNMGMAASLRQNIDKDKIFVSESGIASLEDVKAVKAMGADACLVGEYLMRSNDRRNLLGRMKGV